MADETELFRKLEQVSVDTAAQFLRWVHELGRTYGPPSRRAADPELARGGLLDLARFALDGYGGWLRLHESYVDLVVGGARELGSSLRAAYGEVARERLSIEGRAGEIARKRFHVENEQDTAVELAFRFGEFSANDGRRFAAAATVGPPAADVPSARDRRLEAGERRAFEVAIRLDSATFRANKTYRADIEVVGDGRTLGVLTVDIAVKPAAERA